jgi:hypothetical protein
MMQCPYISTSHEFIDVAAREAENLCDFRHHQETLGHRRFMICGCWLLPFNAHNEQPRLERRDGYMGLPEQRGHGAGRKVVRQRWVAGE